MSLLLVLVCHLFPVVLLVRFPVGSLFSASHRRLLLALLRAWLRRLCLLSVVVLLCVVLLPVGLFLFPSLFLPFRFALLLCSVAPLFSSFPVVAFSGSRSLVGVASAHVALVARVVSASGCAVSVGCAAGADKAVRQAVPTARIFSVQAFCGGGIPITAALAKRSVACLSSALPFGALVAFPVSACPSRARAASRLLSRFGQPFSTA